MTTSDDAVAAPKPESKASTAKKERKPKGMSAKRAKAPLKVKSKGKAVNVPQQEKRPRTRQTQQAAAGSNYPRHTVEQALRIPRAILDQNAGKACSAKEAASFVGVGLSGDFNVEVSSGVKYGFLERPEPGKIRPTERARRVLRPKTETDELDGLREAVLEAPVLSEVYKHYRGENLPDDTFFQNTVTETYGVPAANVDDFRTIFNESLARANLLAPHGDKVRVLDITADDTAVQPRSERIRKLGREVRVEPGDTCFVMQPFAVPLGDYYEKLYKPAIEKAGLHPVRADADIFGAGKIIDQVWRGISSAKVLVAELTSRNPNVFYELGLAHALEKPVVLISSNEADVPFDLQHIRVIYYNVTDPFWGQKLIEKVAENILSAIRNPEEAVFKRLTRS